MQKILTFELKEEKKQGLRKICQQLEIDWKEVPVKDYTQQMGCIAGITGFHRQRLIYRGDAFWAEMLVFSGMDSGQIDAFLAAYKQSGLQAIPLKAVLTEYNVKWTAKALFSELLKEHMAMNR